MTKTPAGKAPAKASATTPAKAVAKPATKPVVKAPAKAPAKATASPARKPAAAASRTAKRPPPMPLHPRSVPILTTEDAAGQPPAPLYDVGPDDTIDPDLRYRMISDLAYRRYVERGYTDGGDVDDWLDAEAEVDHLLGSRRPADTGEM